MRAFADGSWDQLDTRCLLRSSRGYPTTLPTPGMGRHLRLLILATVVRPGLANPGAAAVLPRVPGVAGGVPSPISKIAERAYKTCTCESGYPRSGRHQLRWQTLKQLQGQYMYHALRLPLYSTAFAPVCREPNWSTRAIPDSELRRALR